MKKTDVEKILEEICSIYEWKNRKFQYKKRFHHFDESWDGAFEETEDATFCSLSFRVKEIKGWLFGLWVREVDTPSGDLHWVKYQLFGGYEEDIDKFKPSRMYNVCEEKICINEEEFDMSICEGSDLLQYIYKHRVFASYREIYGVNYNLKPISGVKAMFGVMCTRFRQWRLRLWNNFIEKKTIKPFLKELKKDFPCDNIWLDIDDNRSPHSEFIIVIPEYDEEIPELNHYYHDFGSNVGEICDKWKKIGKIFGIRCIFPNHVSEWITIMDQKDFDKRKELMSEFPECRLKEMYHGVK